MWLIWLVNWRPLRILNNHATLPGCHRHYQMAIAQMAIYLARMWSLVSTEILIHHSIKEKAATLTNKQTWSKKIGRSQCLSEIRLFCYNMKLILPNSYSVLRCYCVKLVRYDPLFVKRFWAYTIFGKSKVQCWNPQA